MAKHMASSWTWFTHQRKTVYTPEENSWQLAELVKLNLANIFTTFASHAQIMQQSSCQITCSQWTHQAAVPKWKCQWYSQ
jgi:hypothetical protein